MTMTAIHEVEARIEACGRALDAVVDETKLQAHLGMMNAEDRWHERKAALQSALAKLRTEMRQARGCIDHARVQAHLAALELGDLASDPRLKPLHAAITALRQAVEAWRQEKTAERPRRGPA